MTDTTAASSVSSTPTLLPPVRQMFEAFRGKPVYFDAGFGNSGDQLIHVGTHEAMRQAGVLHTNKPKGASAITLTGGAGLTPMWKFGFDLCRKYSEQFPGTPLLVMPSSVLFEPPEFADLFKARNAPVTIYARERYSLELLREVKFPCEARLGLDHDAAFMLAGTPFMAQLLGRRAERHLLCVERNDYESVSGALGEAKRSTGARSLVPEWFKRPIRKKILDPIRNIPKRKVMRGKVPLSPMMREIVARVYDELPATKNLPVYSGDISLLQFHTFEEFGTLIAQSAAVVTTRLHVAILACMLGKPTYLRPGTFHKIKGIYDFSMATKPQVRLA
jgi:exopolysaccharide biosynthesis predicted pyruvyltransferase EpsI